jgi:Flp pilus assembly protein TadD
MIMKSNGKCQLLSLVLCFAGCGTSQPAAQPAQQVASAPEPDHAPEFVSGIKAFDLGDYVGARTAFEAAVKSNPKDIMALWDLGQACEKLGDNAAAAAAYRAEIANKPDADQAIAEIANLDVVDGRVDDALEVAKEGLAKRPGSAVLHAAIGNALATRGDQDEAMKRFEHAIELDTHNAMLHYTFAVWLNKWHTRGAAAHLDAAAALVQNDYPMTVSIGHEYRLAGEFPSCVKTFDAAISTKARGEALTERALCKLGLKDESGALADLQSAVSVEPTYPQAHFFLAGRLAIAKRFKDAASEYQTYLQLAPNGSLAEQASERLKMAEDAAAHEKAPVVKKPMNRKNPR